MLNFRLKCPKCGHPFLYGVLKFKSRYECEECHAHIVVEMRLAAMLVQAGVFLVIAQTFMNTMALYKIEMNFMWYVLLFFILLFLMILIDYIGVKLLGYDKIFKVQEYRENPAVTKANKQRNPSKKKKKK